MLQRLAAGVHPIIVGPYRTAEARNLAERVCPWCNARIVVDLDAIAAVCDACGARYAPSLARQRTMAVTATERGRGDRLLRSLALYTAYVAIGIGLACAAVVGAMLLPIVLGMYFAEWKGKHQEFGALLVSTVCSAGVAIHTGLVFRVVVGVTLFALWAAWLVHWRRTAKSTDLATTQQPAHRLAVGGSSSHQ